MDQLTSFEKHNILVIFHFNVRPCLFSVLIQITVKTCSNRFAPSAPSPTRYHSLVHDVLVDPAQRQPLLRRTADGHRDQRNVRKRWLFRPVGSLQERKRQRPLIQAQISPRLRPNKPTNTDVQRKVPTAGTPQQAQLLVDAVNLIQRCRVRRVG